MHSVLMVEACFNTNCNEFVHCKYRVLVCDILTPYSRSVNLNLSFVLHIKMNRAN